VENPRIVSKNILKKSDVTVEVVDGKQIVVISVPKANKADKPIYIGGNRETGAYYRRGESDIRIPKARIEKMIKEGQEEQ
jgi:predicted HTH transcriptional regulator